MPLSQNKLQNEFNLFWLDCFWQSVDITIIITKTNPSQSNQNQKQL